MAWLLVDKFVGRPAGTFVREARALGVKTRVARTLEPAAKELFPDNPAGVLTSRSSFEQAAMHTVIGDAGNLELSFTLVDTLASTVETLGLTRSSDVPDPFRRVWICNEAGDRKRGVVLRCEGSEVAVFCPPSEDRFTDAGPIMKLSYRGFSSSVEYDLRLNDAVRLPGAFVLHLTRPEGAGAIGRSELRLDVRLDGSVYALESAQPAAWSNPVPCVVLDVSAGGVRIASDVTFERGQAVGVEVELPDGIGEPISLNAFVCWNRTDESGLRTQGLQFTEMAHSTRERYERYMGTLLPNADDSPVVMKVATEFEFGPVTSEADETSRHQAEELKLTGAGALPMETQSALDGELSSMLFEVEQESIEFLAASEQPEAVFQHAPPPAQDFEASLDDLFETELAQHPTEGPELAERSALAMETESALDEPLSMLFEVEPESTEAAGQLPEAVPQHDPLPAQDVDASLENLFEPEVAQHPTEEPELAERSALAMETESALDEPLSMRFEVEPESTEAAGQLPEAVPQHDPLPAQDIDASLENLFEPEVAQHPTEEPELAERSALAMETESALDEPLSMLFEVEPESSEAAGQLPEAVPQHDPLSVQDIEASLDNLLETEVAQIEARIAELRARLDQNTCREVVRNDRIEELTLALTEAQEHSETMESALSLFPTVKRMLDKLGDTLSPKD